MRRRIMKKLVLGVVVPALALASCGQLPPGFSQEVVASGFQLPTTWVQTGDPAVQYVAEKAGIVRVVRAGRVRATPLVDLSRKVNDNADRGLLGMALDPGFATNGFLYLAYTYEDPALPFSSTLQTQRITRVTVDRASHVADPGTEQVVLGNVTGPACYEAWSTPDCIPSNAALHTVGDLGFGADGYLWASVGDGAYWPYTSAASVFRVQDVNVLSGKLLRIDPVTGLGVPDNPFFQPEAPGSNASKVYAYGFRNPFRFTFRPGSNVPYVGDVGDSTYEEINHVRRGGNYGWPCYEGPARHPEFTKLAVCQPMYAARTPVIAPAAQYRHSDEGVSITGGTFYAGGSNYPVDYVGDYVYGDYNAFVRRQGFTPNGGRSGEAEAFVARETAGAPVKFGIGPDGRVWYLSIYPGELRRLVYQGEQATTPTTSAPPLPGTSPTVAVAAPRDLVRVPDGATVEYGVTASDKEDGSVPITVDVTYIHYSSGTSHLHPNQTTEGPAGSFVVSAAHGPGHYRITARATDSHGRKTTSAPVDVCIGTYRVGRCT